MWVSRFTDSRGSNLSTVVTDALATAPPTTSSWPNSQQALITDIAENTNILAVDDQVFALFGDGRQRHEVIRLTAPKAARNTTGDATSLAVKLQTLQSVQ